MPAAVCRIAAARSDTCPSTSEEADRFRIPMPMNVLECGQARQRGIDAQKGVNSRTQPNHDTTIKRESVTAIGYSGVTTTTTWCASAAARFRARRGRI